MGQNTPGVIPAMVTMIFDGQELELLARAAEKLAIGNDLQSRQYGQLADRLRQEKVRFHEAHAAAFAARYPFRPIGD